jgi:Holliday junction resolvasome RuvABC ATP-dependent DNA helicase subunit
MQKTTIYLEEKDLKALKLLAAQKSHTKVADLIRQSVHALLKTKEKKEPFEFLKNYLSKKSRGRKKASQSKKQGFKDAVKFQRKLRDEWK